MVIFYTFLRLGQIALAVGLFLLAVVAVPLLVAGKWLFSKPQRYMSEAELLALDKANWRAEY